jgi:hypothetical protein
MAKLAVLALLKKSTADRPASFSSRISGYNSSKACNKNSKSLAQLSGNVMHALGELTAA